MKAEQFFNNGFGADVEKVHRKHVIQLMQNFAEHYHTEQLHLHDVVCSTWYVTNQLRWKQKEVDMMDGTAMSINELQQMWQSDKGEQKWEAVPFVE